MNPTHIVASGGMLPLTSPGSHDDTADTAVPADVVPVVALAALVSGVPVVRLIPETLLTAETFIMGRLGLEPQPQPRQVGRSRPRAIGFPAWPIMTDPDNAEHALNLVADIEWAKKVAKSQKQKVWDRFEELAQMLSTAAPHFVPTLLEELARIFDDSGSPKLAVRAFGKAREFERTYSLPVDLDRHRHALTEFARRGVISAKEMGFEATSCMQRISDPEAAYQYFLGLITDQVSAGSAPYAGLPRDFLRVAKPTGRTPQQAGKELLDSISELSGMRRAPVGFVKALGKHMAGLLDHRPDAVMQLFSTPPTDYYSWYGDHKLEDWTTGFITIGGPNILKEDPTYFRRWLLNVLGVLVGKTSYSPSLVDLIVSNAKTISGVELDETYLGLPLELVEALIIAGARWHLDNVSYEQNSQLESFFDRIQYYRDHRHKYLTHCLENPQIKAHILCGWTLERLLKCGDAVAQVNGGLFYDELLQNECRNLRAAPLPNRFVISLALAAKGYSWVWLSFAGQEKALVSWAMGPFTPPAARMETAVLLRKLAETVRDTSALGAAKTAHDLGVEPGMSAEEMCDWADKLEHMGDIDAGEWLSRMRPLIGVLTARTFLTKTAAIMLLAGGFDTFLSRELAIAVFRRAGGDDLRAAEEERAKTIRRKLRLTRKTTLAATALLTRVDPMSRELLATAAFDNNAALVDAFVAGLPACELAIPDQLMEKYLAESWAASDEKIRILFQLLRPLKPHPHFSGWNGGMVASIALDLATNLPAQGFADEAEARKVCKFLVHQLTTLKTATGKNISSNHTCLPLTGDINHIKDKYKYYWGYIDAFRGLTEGHFDKIITDLGDETKYRPAGCYRDPRVSAPTVVAEVCQELELSEPAAVYFLQLLALVDPTDSNVKAWNGWKKKQFDEARAELVAHDLVVEGKRTGAGRTVFLPGTWWEAQSGSMPVEAWKSNFYLIRYRERCENTVRWCPPTEPFDQLFQTVWGRWLSGDRPSFDALTTKKYRR